MKKPIRILHVLGRTDRGGAESLVMNIYRNIDREKIQFDFAIHTNERCQYDDEIESLGGNIYHIPRYKIYNHYNYIKSWEHLLKNNTFTAIHGHMDSTASIYLKIAKKYGIPTIAHSHSTSSGKDLKSTIIEFYHRGINSVSDYKFACSKEAGYWLYGKDTKFIVINNGIDTYKYKFNEENRIRTRNDLGISNDDIVLIHVGNYRPVKNHNFIVDIFNKLGLENDRYKLIFVGARVKENIHSRVNKNVENNILFLGSRSDVDNLLKASDIFLLPSIYEGLPVTTIEAQTSGLKCLVSDNVSYECKLTDNIEFVDIDDINSKDIWISKIIEYKNYLRKDMSQEVRKKGYDIKDVALDLQKFYENI